MPSPAELEKILKSRQNVSKRANKAGAPSASRDKVRFRWPIRSRETTDFTRQLATMVSARLPLARSLEILSQQQKNLRLQKIILDVRQNLVRGKSLSDSLAQHPNVFTPLFVNMVQVGEVSGNLPEILQQLATYLEKMSELKRKLLTAMTYPAVIMLVAGGALAFLLFGVMPTFTDLFREFGAPMPLPTRILLSTAAFLRANFIFLLALFFAAVAAARIFAQTAKGSWMLDAVKIKMPLMGSIVKKVLLARFGRTLGTLLQSGVSLLEALEIAARSSGNQIFEREILRMKSMAARGEAMELSISKSRLFPPLVVQMIAVGEETAELDVMLTKTAEFYESEVDAALEALTSVIEPIIIVVLGVVLGGAMIAIYLQIFDLMNVIQ